MKSILICLMLGVSLFMGGCGQIKTFDNIQDVFTESCCIEVIIDDSSKEYNKQSQEYNKILDEFQNMIDGFFNRIPGTHRCNFARKSVCCNVLQAKMLYRILIKSARL